MSGRTVVRKAGKLKTQGRWLNNIVVGFFAILFFIPLYFFFNNVFKIGKYISTNPMILTPESATLDNILGAFKLMRYPESFFNSLIILVLSSLLLIVLGSMAAYIIAIVNNRGLRRLYFFLIALNTLPVYVAMIPLARLLAQLGLISTHIGIVFVYVAFGLPFSIFLYVGNIRALPRELYESATIDGGNMYQIYLFIYMPLLKTVTGTVLILRGMYIWNDILIPLITVRGSAMQTLPLRLWSFSSTHMIRWDMMFGAAFLVSLPIIILFLFIQKTFIQGIVEGSLKG